MGRAVRAHRRRAAVLWCPSEFPSPVAGIWRFESGRDRSLSGQSHPAPALPRRGGIERRSVLVHAMIDLLAIGPHPDDLEIGMGGTIARHTALGMKVGLCDLTAGEMGSNGTPDERLAEAGAARVVLGAVWRQHLRRPERRLGMA